MHGCMAKAKPLKKMGRTIDKRVLVDSPKTVIYDAHLTAMQTELDYALYKRDYFWVKIRLRQYKESVLDDDPNLPKEMIPRAEKLFEKFRRVIQSRKRLTDISFERDSILSASTRVLSKFENLNQCLNEISSHQKWIVNVYVNLTPPHQDINPNPWRHVLIERENKEISRRP